MTEQDKQALIKHFCERDCGEAAKDCPIMPCHEIELIQEFQTTEPDTDTISRAKAIDALRAMQTYKLFAGDDMLLIDQAGAQTELMMLPPANNSEIPNSSDTISRQAAIDGKICIQRSNGVEIYDDYVVPVEYLEQLPLAQPKRIKGHWIIRETSSGDTEARCSHCGFTTLVDEPGNGLHMVSDLNFCPNCGADMREVTE